MSKTPLYHWTYDDGTISDSGTVYKEGNDHTKPTAINQLQKKHGESINIDSECLTIEAHAEYEH